MARNNRGPRVAGILLGAFALAGAPALADFEVTAPDGRRVLLKNDNTWRYVESKPSPAAAGKDDKPVADTAAKQTGEAVLQIESRADVDRNCRIQLRLANHLPYEIRSLVPEFSAYRASGVIYDSVFASFQFLKPGDEQRREVRFRGIACQDIGRLQVGGGDRCDMGDLDRFTPVRGKCLALIRVVPSELVRFDK
jgi:hypothetical protein